MSEKADDPKVEAVVEALTKAALAKAEAKGKAKSKAKAVEPEAPSITEQAAVMAALPMIESPTISPDPATEPAAAPEAAAEAPQMPNASARFRAAAAAQIAAARERLEKRNAPSMVAVALVAGLTGAVGTSALSSMKTDGAPAINVGAIETSLTRIDDEIIALRNKMEHSAQLATEQTEKTGERLAQIEKAQAEPVAKLSKLAELVEKIRNASLVTPAMAGDITGSVPPAQVAAIAKPKPAAPAIVEGWALRELDRDIALVEGKRGLVEIGVGDSIPGVGRVEGFRKHEGQWAVVTAKGLIVSPEAMSLAKAGRRQ